MKTYSIVVSNYIPGAEDFVKTLQPGLPVTLVREPANEHDRNAIAVWVEGRKIGYLPKKQNVALAAFIDQTGVGLFSSANFDIRVSMAMDDALRASDPKAIPAKFVRSPNSGYPMVEV